MLHRWTLLFDFVNPELGACPHEHPNPCGLPEYPYREKLYLHGLLRREIMSTQLLRVYNRRR